MTAKFVPAKPASQMRDDGPDAVYSNPFPRTVGGSMKLCRCGSNLYSHQLLDAANIFCAYVCSHCEAETRKRFKPAIFESGTPYSRSGSEEDLEIDYDQEH